jgi:2-dehydropantoate 2-reductase
MEVFIDRDQVLIVGTGAMACLFAARFAAAGVPFSMMGTWTHGLEALQKSGVCIIDHNDQESCYPVQILSGDTQGFKANIVLLLVKSWQTQRTAQRLVNIMAPDGVVLTLQNGLGNLEALQQVLGIAKVAVGVTTIGATLIAPGRVRLGGEGEISLTKNRQNIALANNFRRAGFIVKFTEDIEALLWGKLVVNSAINPLTALFRVSNGDLLQNESSRQLMNLVAEETAGIASAKGIQLPFDNPKKVVESVASRTATNRSSMLQDIDRGAPTEIDAISGAIVQIGKELGIETPFNYAFWLSVKAAVNFQQGIGIQ